MMMEMDGINMVAKVQETMAETKTMTVTMGMDAPS